jgi:perosamine synthetase
VIPVYKPFLNEEILKYAHDALDSGWISSTGKYKQLTSELLCEKIGTKYSYLTCNGTVSCHLMSKVLRKFYPDKNKIIVPNNCYVAAWNSLLFDGENNVELVPVDANLETWNIELGNTEGDIYYIVHNLGNIINVPKLKRENPDKIFVEDACEAFFGEYEGVPAGSASLCSAFSFFGNKNISAGEGGAVVTNEKEIHDYIVHVSEQAQTTRFVHNELGYNYRMSNVHAAILYGQLKYSDEIMENKRRVFDEYNRLFKDTGIETQKIEKNTKHSCWMYGIKFKNKEVCRCVESKLNSAGIDTRPMFYSIGKHDHLSSITSKNKNANILSETCLVLPSYPNLSNMEISTIVESVKKYHED